MANFHPGHPAPRDGSHLTPEDSRMRGRSPQFSPEDIIAAALRLGIADFTMSQVARQLGVTTPALYRAFPNRDALVIGCLRHIFGPLELPSETVGWRDLLTGFAVQLWEQLLTYPGLHEVLTGNPAPPPTYYPALGTMFDRLAGHGFSRGQAVYVTFFLLDRSASLAGMLHRQSRWLDEFAKDSPAELRTVAGERITSTARLAECVTGQWSLETDMFLDHMEILAPNWPLWAGPYLVHRRS